MRLKGKHALITGGDQGIGRGIALRFAQEGADVAIGFLSNDDHAKSAVEEMRSHGVNAAALQIDVSNIGALAKFYADATRALGPLDVLVNNAGIEKRDEFLKSTEDDFDSVIAVNLKGPYFLSQLFARDLAEAKRPGKIINISSVHEELPFPNFASYCAAKGGLKMLCRNLAIELAPYGITVNNIAPGAIKTPINDKLLHDPSKLKPLLEHIPLKRMGTTDDVAGCAAFLASSDADYITGTTLVVDGGLLFNYHEQ
ncbi:short-chain dehydrogenase/reductase SDR [Candidatus Koribacter versatilis Ellin345]|uniref:Short-chain dehydrogenase/reductase SDR n=1 Tax=Koribacter versatilis (strain Ellin345) TaxID=204669 RepID=Q1IKU0_KORVE|nr:glucose 1-dehydrogenase [Candidatus Koribacter versatilis]ABF42510.1 short-chain dehydrogenase/reductase SDR [Candidatus Koribacter versatilis Ellin345]